MEKSCALGIKKANHGLHSYSNRACVIFCSLANTACLNKVPYASMIAFVMTFAGAGIFCGTLYEALRLMNDTIFSDMFNFRFDW